MKPLRIFYASDTTPNAFFASDIWRKNLLLPLIDLGHDVVEFQCDLRDVFQNLDPADPKQAAFIAGQRPKTTRELLRQFEQGQREKPFDLFFSYFTDACVEADVVDEIKSMGVATANWYCNGSNHMELVREIAPRYDWCLVPEKDRLEDYRALGARPIYCQEAANPHFYKPISAPAEFDAAFIGQAYGERPAYIAGLLHRGVDIRVWGAGWDAYTCTGATCRKNGCDNARRPTVASSVWRLLRAPFARKRPSENGKAPSVHLPRSNVGGILSDEEVVRTFSRAKINLGFSACYAPGSGERILQIRLRDFEAPMSGGFYMVEHMEELEEFFDIGKEIVCYRGLDDLAEKIKYYLAHKQEREAIRQRGRQRCLRDHTWHKRLTDAFAQMGLG